MYSVLEYGQMISDAVRMESYAEALRRVVRPESVVLDVGAGTGIFSLLACRYGARRVYAVEPASVIEVAREMARRNGVGERIVFLACPIEEVELPRRVDVIVSDMRGTLPISGRNVANVALARERFLAPGGRLIPLRDQIFTAPVEAPLLHRRNIASWLENRWQLDMEPARCAACNVPWAASKSDLRLLAPGQRVHTIEYGHGDTAAFASRVHFESLSPGTVHGLALWFEAEVAEGIQFSTGPEHPDTVYGRLVLPLDSPVEIATGGSIDLGLRADPVADDFVWSWDTRVVAARAAAARVFFQSTFLGEPLSSDRLRRQTPSHAPGLSSEGEVARLTIELMRDGLTVEDIARRVAGSFPDRFGSWKEAWRPVTRLSHSYGAN
jgi:protein arginine N-methyltransferase 1